MSARGRRSLAILWWGLVVLPAGGCGGVQRVERPALLRVVAKPDTARVYVDDRFRGIARTLAIRPAPLAPGRRYVTVTAGEHFPHDIEVMLRPGVTTMRIALRPVPQ